MNKMILEKTENLAYNRTNTMVDELESTVLGTACFRSKKSEVDPGRKKKMDWAWNQESTSFFRLA